MNMQKIAPLAAPLLLALCGQAAAQSPTGIGAASSSVSGLVKNGHPGFVTNNWYVPFASLATAGTPVTPGAGKIVCAYGTVGYPVTLNTLGIVVTTTDNTKRFQLGIYSNGSWGRPSTLLANTADITLSASTGAYTGAVSVSIQDGGAWFCINTESTVAVFVSLATATNNVMSSLLGSATQTTVGSQSASITGISVAQSYGSWPASFGSGQGWTEIATAITPYIQFKVASSP